MSGERRGHHAHFGGTLHAACRPNEYGVPDSPVSRLAEVTSTIDEARRLAEEGAEHGTVVLAERQTAGRGRRGHGWHTLPGKSLALTVILRELPERSHLSLAGMTAALATVEAVRELLEVRLWMKWPNDVLAGGRKIAGVLAERRHGVMLLSLGLNVNGGECDLPEDIRETATTLEVLVGHPVDREALLQLWLGELDRLWAELLRNPAAIVRRWRRAGGRFPR